jgi:hypothetical protein
MVCVVISRRGSGGARKIKPRAEECAGFFKLKNPCGSLAVFLRGASHLKSPRQIVNIALLYIRAVIEAPGISFVEISALKQKFFGLSIFPFSICHLLFVID